MLDMDKLGEYGKMDAQRRQRLSWLESLQLESLRQRCYLFRTRRGRIESDLQWVMFESKKLKSLLCNDLQKGLFPFVRKKIKIELLLFV